MIPFDKRIKPKNLSHTIEKGIREVFLCKKL